MDHVETELKLRMAKKDIKAFLSSSLVTKHVLKGSSQVLPLLSTYYDTADFALQQAGIAYRVRCTGKKCEATIKSDKAAASGLSARREITIPLKEPLPSLQGFDSQDFHTDLSSLVNNEPLQKLFTVRVRRQVKLLKLSRGTVAELAVDQGEIKSGKKGTDKIEELELELKQGPLAPLLRYAAKMAGAYPLLVEPRSKYVRGLTLMGKPLAQGAPAADEGMSGKKPLAVEMRREFFYYSNLILTKQNILLSHSGKVEPVRDLREPFLYLEALLWWLSPIVTPVGILQKYLAECLEPLHKLAAVDHMLLQWHIAAAQAGIKEDGLKKNLLSLRSGLEAKIQNQVRKGVYTKVLFKYMAAMTGDSWQSWEGVTVDKYLSKRAAGLKQGLVLLQKVRPGQKLLPEDIAKQELFLNAGQKMLSLTKVGGWNKEISRHLVKAAAVSAELSDLERGLYLLLKAARQKKQIGYAYGLLQGWCLQLQQKKQAKAGKEIEKLLASLS